jgi:hypothetical protein
MSARSRPFRAVLGHSFDLRLQWRVPVTTLEVRVTYLTFHRLTRRVPPVRRTRRRVCVR